MATTTESVIERFKKAWYSTNEADKLARLSALADEAVRDYHGEYRTPVFYLIRLIVCLAGGPDKALELTFALASQRVSMVSQRRRSLCEKQFANLDLLLAQNILGTQWQLLKRSADCGRWDPAVLLQELRRLARAAKRQSKSEVEIFLASRKILQACVWRHTAYKVALKAVGSRLPAELVELVQDSIFGKEDFKYRVAWSVAKAQANSPGKSSYV